MKLVRLFSAYGCILLIFTIGFTGCQTAVGGREGEKSYYLKRNLTMPNQWEVTVPGSIRHVHDAVFAGVEDLNLKIWRNRVDSLSGVIEGTFADDTTVRVTSLYKTEDITVVRLNVGLLGNKELIVQLFRAIEKYL